MVANQETGTSTSSFTVDDVIARLGVAIVSDEDAATAVNLNSTALAEFRAAPTIKAIARDLARVAAFTSDDPEAVRGFWLNRLVMTVDAEGRPTERPLIIGIEFDGQEQTISGVRDIGVGAWVNVPSLGRIQVQPLFTVGVDYISARASGTFFSIRKFYGVLFAPKQKGGARDKGRSKKGEEIYKFVPLELADPLLIARWNGIVEQGEKLDTVHKDWPRIEPLPTNIGKQGQSFLELAPSYMEKREFPKRHRGQIVTRGGQPVMEVEWRIATRFLKTVTLHPRSQGIPVVERDGGVVLAPGKFVFTYVERENSIIVMLRGRPGEVTTDEALTTIDEVGDQMNPFDVLDTSVERFEIGKVRQFVANCLEMSLNTKNPLYCRAIELGLVIEGQPTAVVRAQLQALSQEALRKAQSLYDEAFKATLAALRRYDAPSIEDCLSGNRLDRTLGRLNPDDVAAKFITQHIEGDYSHANLFHRSLRAEVLKLVAKRAGYADPAKSETVSEAPVVTPPA